MKQGICAFAVAAVLAGCGNQSFGTGTLAAHPRALSRADQRPTWISPDARKERQLLFVSDFPTGSVVIFAVPKLRLVGKIPGFSSPRDYVGAHTPVTFGSRTPAQGRCPEYSHSGAFLSQEFGMNTALRSAVRSIRGPANSPCSTLPRCECHSGLPAPRGWAPIEVFACPVCTPTVKVVPGMDEIYFGDYDKRGNLYVDGFDTSRAVQLGTVPWGKYGI